MDDDAHGNGLSGWAFHELGRQSERSYQNRMNVVANFAARLRGERPVNVGALIAQNQALWQQNQDLLRRNQDLQAELRDWRLDYRKLTEWAEGAEAALARLGATIRPREEPSAD